MKHKEVFAKTLGVLVTCAVSFGVPFLAECQEQISLPLKQGWNLVALPLQPTNTAIMRVVAPITNVLEAVWAYDNGRWYGYNPSVPGLNDLKTMEVGKAYWIKVRQDCVLPIVGTRIENLPTTNIEFELKPGWNLVGYTASQPQDPSIVLAPIAHVLSSAQTFVGTNWIWYPNFTSLSTSNNLVNPYQGLWLFVTTNARFTAPNFKVKVVDATTGKPIGKAVVTIDGIEASVEIDQNGNFIIPGIPDNTNQLVTVIAENFAPIVMSINPFQSSNLSGGSGIDGQPPSQLKIALSPLPAPNHFQIFCPQNGSLWIKE